jgi:hypothetical protein
MFLDVFEEGSLPQPLPTTRSSFVTIISLQLSDPLLTLSAASLLVAAGHTGKKEHYSIIT